jgi:hypothetical protein
LAILPVPFIGSSVNGAFCDAGLFSRFSQFTTVENRGKTSPASPRLLLRAF